MSGRSSPASVRGRRFGHGLAGLLSAGVLGILGLSVLTLSLTLSLTLGPAGLAAAKTVRNGADGSANAAADRGFSIAFDDRLSDSLARFDEYVRTHAWEKAFRILADLPEEKWSAMLPDGHGFIRPVSLRVRQTLLELPADGREAYRLYFDAKARRLFDSIGTARKEDDAATARAIYERYFITSVGDDAADRLAEDYFEQGQFEEAARCWKSIFDFHPDSNLPEARLLAKRAIALYRGGFASEFQSVRRQMNQEFPGARIVLGGRDVLADDYLKGLETGPARKTSAPAPASAHQKTPGAPGSESAFAGLAPPDGAQPVWQCRFLEEKDLAALEESFRNWYGMAAITTIVPAAVTDGERLYTNWLGACFAIDVASGKTVWATEPGIKSLVSQLKANTGRMTLYSINTAQFALTLGQEGPGKGVLLAVSAVRSEPNRFQLAAYDASNGRTLWTSGEATTELAHASFIGAPLVAGNSIFALSYQVASESRQPAPVARSGATANQIVLRRLDLQTGTEVWPPLPLGTPQFVGDPDWGRQFLPIPSLTLSGDRLYVLTNDGALLAVRVGRRQIEWAYKYEPPATAGNGRGFNFGAMPGRHAASAAPIVVRDGTVYFKESTSPTLYALDESGPQLKWKWQDSDFANLVGIDEGDIYLFSNELSAISRTKPETRWSNRLTVDLQGIGARIGSRGAVVFTPRGLFELSKETGDVRRIFRGADLGSAGGFVLSAKKRLLCVSNLAVTAYPELSTN